MGNEIKSNGAAGSVGVQRITGADEPGKKTASLPGFTRFLNGIDRTGWSDAVGKVYPPLRPESPTSDLDPVIASCTKLVHSGAGPIKGTIYLCLDETYKGPGQIGDDTFLAEFKAALAKTDYGRFYDVRLITAKDGIETIAKHSKTMNGPPNMALVIHGEPLEANTRWNKATGQPDSPFTTTGLAPGQFEQPVSVGRLASKAEYTNPRLAAFVACHELGHRLFDVADGSETDAFGGWGDFPYEPKSDGISGSYNLMTDGGPMMAHLNTLNKGKPSSQYAIPDEYYKMPRAFLDGLSDHPGIDKYLNRLPTRR